MNSPNPHRIRAGEIDERPVSAALEHLLGQRPLALRGRETKAPRFVWEATLTDGQCVYVKAEHQTGGDDALVLEAWACERARDLGVPAPRTLAMDISGAIFPGRLLVQETAAGRPLAPVWRAPVDDEVVVPDDVARSVWRTAGGHLRRLHTLHLVGYGRLQDAHYLATGQVRGGCASCSDAVLGPARDALAFIERHHGWSAGDIARASTALEELDDVFSTFSDPRLLHGDLAAKHLFVDATGQLTAVIDFGDREAGDPARDLGNIALWEDDQRLQWALDGYGDVTPHFRRRILAYTLADGLRVAAERVKQGRRAAAQASLSWLEGRLDARLGRPDW